LRGEPSSRLPETIRSTFILRGLGSGSLRGIFAVFEREENDFEVLSIAVRPDEQQWRIIHFTLNDLLKYKKKTHREKIL
jgi:hypothetical protein